MRQAQEARVRVVAALAPEPHRVGVSRLMVRRRTERAILTAPRPVSLVDRRVKRSAPQAKRPPRLTLHHRALRVIREVVGGAVTRHIPRPQAVGSPARRGGDGGCGAAVGFSGHGACAVVKKVGGDGGRAADGRGGLFDPQAVAVIRRRERRAADAGQAIFRVKGELLCRKSVLVGRWVKLRSISLVESYYYTTLNAKMEQNLYIVISDNASHVETIITYFGKKRYTLIAPWAYYTLIFVFLITRVPLHQQRLPTYLMPCSSQVRILLAGKRILNQTSVYFVNHVLRIRWKFY